MSSPHRFTRPVTILAGTAVAACALVACGPSQVEPKAPGAAKPAAQPSAAVPAPELAKIDAGLVAGLKPVTYVDEGRHVRAEVPQIGAARNLTQALEVVRERALRSARWAKSDSARVGWQLIGSSPDAVGIQVTSTTTQQSRTIETPSAIWYDVAARQSFSSPILIDPTRWTEFKRQVVETAAAQSLGADKITKALDSDPAPQGSGPAIGFDTAANIIVNFGSGALTEEPVMIMIPKDKIDPVLSGFGRAAQSAAAHPAQFTGNAATPSPSTHSPSPNRPPGTPTSGAAGTPSATPAATGAAPSGSAQPAPGSDTAPAQRPSTAVGPDCHKLACVALTYDDGPDPRTPEVLEALTRAKAAATFFQLGNNVRAYPDVTKQVASSGQEIASHSVSHADLGRAGAATLDKEVRGNSEILSQVTGRPPLLFRPPYGSHKAATDQAVGKQQMAIIQWNQDTNDWKNRNTAITTAVATKADPAQAAIVLMHDIHPSTIAAAPGVIEGLQAKGVTLVTVSELTLNDGGVQAGHSYCRGTRLKQEGFDCTG